MDASEFIPSVAWLGLRCDDERYKGKYKKECFVFNACCSFDYVLVFYHRFDMFEPADFSRFSAGNNYSWGFINVWKIFKSADESKRVVDSLDIMSNNLDKLNSTVDKIKEQQDEQLGIDKEKLGIDKERRVDEVRDRNEKNPF